MKINFRLYLLTLTSLLVSNKNAIAQTYQPTNRIPIADSTLGTQVSGNGNNFNVTGGLTKGQTLFHSFTDFSVPTNGAANFVNATNPRDIITRVTGGVFSDINGLVNTNGANFFLINPNGITFGTNARLNVGKAFVGSTANGIDLVDGSGRMITFGANPSGDAPLLSIAPNVLFDVSRLNMGGGTGAISNFGTLQTQNNSQYIGLIGGNVTLDGSGGGGKIIAPGGRIDIGGLNGAGNVSVDNNGLVFSSSGVGRSNVLLTDGAGITVRATGTLDTVNTFFNNATAPGSSINISANNLDLLNAGAISNTLPAAIDAGLETNSGVQTKSAGNINIDATGKVTVNNSAIKNTLRAGAEGSIGDIKIQAGTLDVNNNSIISSLTAGKGNAGNVTVTAKDAVSLTGISGGIFSSVSAGGVGNGGTIEIDAGSLSITNGAQLSTNTLGASDTQAAGQGNAGNVTVKVTGAVDISGNNGTFSTGILSYVDTATKGNAGNISISAGSLSLRDGAQLSAGTYGIGNAGKIAVTAKDAITLVNGQIFSTVEAGGVGKGGTIEINSGSLSLTNGGQLGTGTRAASATEPAGQGDAGDITVKVSGAVDLAGNNGKSSSGIFSYVNTGTKGNGGNLSIAAGSLSLRDGAILRASTSGLGNAGNIAVTAKDAVALVNGDIFSNVEAGGVGKGGTIEINSGSLSITNGGQLGTGTRGASATQPAGQGDAGDITVKVSGAVDVAGNNGKSYSGIFSYVDTGTKGNGGNLSIAAGSLSLRDGAILKASTYGTGNAGDINLKTTGNINISGYDPLSINPIASDTSTISSNNYGQGDTGKITINTQGKLSVINGGEILSAIGKTAVGGDSKGIDITARELKLANNSIITTGSLARGNAGDINIKTTGDINISGYDSSSTNPITSNLSQISSSNQGQGDAGKITIDTTGKLFIFNNGSINSTISNTAVGNSKGIKIAARELELANDSYISSNTFQPNQVNGKGNAGDITIKTTGDIKVSGYDSITNPTFSQISSRTYGQGGAGKITIDTQGNLSLVNQGVIANEITSTGVGNSPGISINAKDLNLSNYSRIESSNNGGIGNAGSVDIKNTGNFNISGVDTQALIQLTDPSPRSGIFSTNIGKGNAGKITIDTTGKLSLNNYGGIFNSIEGNGVGNSEGIKISAGELGLNNNSNISSATFTSGNAGNIEITTGKYTADNYSVVFGDTSGDGNAGNISLNAKSVTLLGGSAIVARSEGKGTAGNMTITTPSDGFITISGTAPIGKLIDGRPGGFGSGLFATAEKNSSNVAGKISLTTGTLKLENGGAISTRTRTNTAPIEPNNPKSLIVDGKYPAEPGVGSISIDAKNINITGGGQISTTSTGNAPAGDVILKNASTKLNISGSDPNYEQRKAALAVAFPNGYTNEGTKTNQTAQEVIEFTTSPIQYSGIFANNGLGSTGKGGTIILNPLSVTIADSGQISVNNQGTGEGGNIFLVSNLVTLNNGKISAESANTTGGNINLTTTDYLLLRNGSSISTNSGSNGKNGNGGNITISSPIMIAVPGNNDITANAYQGAGGNVNITSQGLFGIQYRPIGSPLTNDITSSSTFGQSGAVNISTPGIDPGRDTTELPNATTDASTQISQVCSASNNQNKLTVTGRGGLPPNANDPLTSDVVWQDARAASSQPAVSSVPTPAKLAPPAVGWVFDGKGKVTLVAAGTQGQPTGTRVVCPK